MEEIEEIEEIEQKLPKNKILKEKKPKRELSPTTRERLQNNLQRGRETASRNKQARLNLEKQKMDAKKALEDAERMEIETLKKKAEKKVKKYIKVKKETPPPSPHDSESESSEDEKPVFKVKVKPKPKKVVSQEPNEPLIQQGRPLRFI